MVVGTFFVVMASLGIGMYFGYKLGRHEDPLQGLKYIVKKKIKY